MKTGFIRTAGFLLGISLLLGGAALAQEATDAGDQEALSYLCAGALNSRV